MQRTLAQRGVAGLLDLLGIILTILTSPVALVLLALMWASDRVHRLIVWAYYGGDEAAYDKEMWRRR